MGFSFSLVYLVRVKCHIQLDVSTITDVMAYGIVLCLWPLLVSCKDWIS